MRFGVVLSEPWAGDAELLEKLGFDLAWIDERTAAAPLVVAAAVAPATSSLRLAACVVAGMHPVALAEEAVTADLASGGRLVLALSGAQESLLTETFDVLQLAFAARPFSHPGSRWQIPAQLPEHQDVPARLRVTPAPAQLELPLWLAGPAASRAGIARAATFVGSAAEAGREGMTEAWSQLERVAGRAAMRLRRPGLHQIAVDADGQLDTASLVQELRAAREAWALDVAILRLPSNLVLEARAEALKRISRAVRPHLQLDALPPGLERAWASREAGQPIQA